ncbi:MAG TPA: iron-containing alcohol dehydrogenase [Treponemataceae bacterium]|jgi:alcohol dehydrogenase class IV|nr:iron-containing alcohol dehydrogenase [Treponemataceae bacterium]
MHELRKFVVPEVVFGEGASSLCDRYALNFGSERPLIVTDPGIIATGLVDTLRASLAAAGLSPEVFSGIRANPRDVQVQDGCDFYRAKKCDIIIGVGGGSPMDCAKAIGILAANGGSVSGFEGIDNVDIPGPPLICIPTTAGTSADISQFAIINDTRRHLKFAIISKTTVPDVALIDPAPTRTMNPYLAACTGIDALVHAIEACVSTASSPITDLHALEAVRVIAANLEASVQDARNENAREALMYASMQAGMAFSNASLGVVHAMAHSLGGLLDLPHGECIALLLAPAIELNFDRARDKYIAVARAAGIPAEALGNGQAAEALIDWISRLLERVGIAPGLASRGVRKETIPLLAQNAVSDPCAVTNPMPLDSELIQRLYERAL